MPEIIGELETMVSIPSCSFPGFPAEPVEKMGRQIVSAFERYGVTAELAEVPGGYPAVVADIPAPPGKPTVLLYAHYDVQPAPPEQGWDTDPFTPTHKGGRLFGRGAADDKSGIAIHLATLAAFDGKPPVGIRILIEGEEETISHLDSWVKSNPERVQADAMVIADMGNLEVGRPVLSTKLRGHVKAVVEVSTLENPVHSGLFGGAAPDAWMALIRMLATLVDEDGTCRVDGILSDEWDGAEYDEGLLRSNAGVLDGVDLIGRDSIASRLWAKPSISVLGMDAVPVDQASNVLQPGARAIVAMRIPPGQDKDDAITKLMDHLRSAAPWNVHVDVKADKVSPPFAQSTAGDAFGLMRESLAEAYGHEVETVGSGGSIPLVETLSQIVPKADFLLTGAQDAARANIHGPNESVDLSEIEHMALAQTLFLQRIAE